MNEYLGFGRTRACTISEPRAKIVTTLAGYELEIEVKVSGNWPTDKEPIHVFPESAEVTALAQSRDEAKVGTATPEAGGQLLLKGVGGRGTWKFVLPMTREHLTALEAFRDGKALALHLTVSARAAPEPGSMPESSTAQLVMRMDMDLWRKNLESVGFSDFIVVEIRVPKSGASKELMASIGHLKAALAKRGAGYPSDAVGECRLAVDALLDVGFGGKAPGDVHKFITERSKQLTMSERFGAVQAALKIYCATPHHTRKSPYEASRTEATSLLAMTAALISLAPARGREPPPDEESVAPPAEGA